MKLNNELIKKLRLEKGLRLSDVAKRLNSSEPTISRYESGQIKRASPEVLVGYSKLFRIPISSLYESSHNRWESIMEEASVRDPRVMGFIEYLEEQADKEINLSETEAKFIRAYRNADAKSRQIAAYVLGLTE